MRMLLKVQPSVEAGNEAVRSGRIAEIIQSSIQLIDPEAVYFVVENGGRTGFMFFNLEDSSQIPVIVEPLFQNLNANVEVLPAMNLEELQRGLSQMSGS
jgi:hypothetical protein